MNAEGRGNASGVSAPSMEAAIGQAVYLVAAGDAASAARLLDHALAAAPPGNAGWVLPVEPLLNVSSAPDLWGPVLARLRSRAA